MKTMPTAFLVTSLSDTDLVEEAVIKWGWAVEKRVNSDLIFVTSTEEVVRATRSASQASHLRAGTKIYLGPGHVRCDGIDELIKRASSGVFDAYIFPADLGDRVVSASC